MCTLSRVLLFVTAWTVVHQTPLSMGFSRQEYWSVLPFLLLGDLPDPGMEPTSLASPTLPNGLFISMSSGKPITLKMRASTYEFGENKIQSIGKSNKKCKQ